MLALERLYCDRDNSVVNMDIEETVVSTDVRDVGVTDVSVHGDATNEGTDVTDDAVIENENDVSASVTDGVANVNRDVSISQPIVDGFVVSSEIDDDDAVSTGTLSADEMETDVVVENPSRYRKKAMFAVLSNEPMNERPVRASACRANRNMLALQNYYDQVADDGSFIVEGFRRCFVAIEPLKIELLLDKIVTSPLENTWKSLVPPFEEIVLNHENRHLGA